MSEPDEYIRGRRDDLAKLVAERASKAYEQREEKQWLESSGRKILFALFAFAVLSYAVLASGYLVWFEAGETTCTTVRTERTTTTRSSSETTEQFKSRTCTPHSREVPLWLSIALLPIAGAFITIELVMRRRKVEVEIGPVHVKFGTDTAIQALEGEVATDDALRAYDRDES